MKYLLYGITGLVVVTSGAWAQVVVNGAGSYEQNFNTLPTATGAWENHTSLPGWFARTESEGGVATLRAGSGGGTTGGLYSFGYSQDSDRALGTLTSPGTSGVWFGLALTNGTAHTLLLDEVSFFGEQWRSVAGLAEGLSVAWRVTAAMDFDQVMDWENGWQPIAGLQFNNPVNSPSGMSQDGNDPANRTWIQQQLGLSWDAGEMLWLRWLDQENTGGDHGLAIDDLSLTFQTVPEPGIAGMLFLSLGWFWGMRCYRPR